ncbi:MAG: multi-sensor signal transduction histidine kinase [Gammaproteobacteria bacterium]|nr:multi-sensor signal transduction histidine kinase [Gammaproteobacteria bacterium]
MPTATVDPDAASASFAEVDIRAALASRPRRTPNYEVEVRAMTALADELARNPQTILQSLVEAALELCHADTAGISLLEREANTEVFRWEALAGVFAASRNRTIPRNASPSAVCIDENATQLMHLADRCFPALRGNPRSVETLLAPLHCRGRPIGTVWIVTHRCDRQFDGEDERIVRSLAAFASAGWQLWQSHSVLERNVAERTEALAQTNLALQQEIDGRKHIEAQLRRSEAYLAEGQRLSQTGSWAWNVLSGELWWSAEHYRIFGLEPQTTRIEYPAAMQWMHPEDRAFVQQAFEKSIRERGDFELDCRIVRADGAVRHVHSLAHPVFGAVGELSEYVGTIIDTTERREVEAQLRAEYARTEMLLNCIPDRFFGIDPHWRFTFFNKQAEEQLCLLGKNPRNLIGKVLWEEFPNAELEPQLRRAMAERIVITHEYFSARLGEWLDNRIYPSPDSGLAVFQSYITERKRSEEELRLAHRELARVSRVLTVGEIASSITHEISQPLTAIIIHGSACIRWLRRDIPNIDEAAISIGRMVRDAVRASNVLKALRSLVEKRNLSQPAPVELNDVIEQAIMFMNDELRGHQVNLRTQLRKGLPAVLGDRTQLEQVLLNLIINSKEAMACVEARDLIISSDYTAQGKVSVTVRDSGTGVPSKDPERMFEAFYTTKEGGLGLGLSISRTIVEAHGGKLIATNNDGPGATFHMVLPAIPA